VTLIVPDCEGKCIVELQSKFIELGGLANITVTFQNMKKPITAMYLMLIKAEHIEDLTLDKVILGLFLLLSSCKCGSTINALSG
jgi:hypothetical protein